MPILLLALAVSLLTGCGGPPEDGAASSGAAQATAQPVTPGGPVKIFVDQPGMHEISLDELAIWGLAAEPQKLRLSHRGVPQALWLTGEGDEGKLRFYAGTGDSLYTTENIYWLQLDSGPPLWMEQPAAGPAAVGEAVTHHRPTLRLEENLRYSPRAEEGDHFFWHILAAPGSQRFEFDLDGTSAGAGMVRVALWSSTEAQPSPDHQLRVLVNGQLVAEETWEGIGRQTLEVEVPAGVLRDGTNEVLLEAPGLEGVLADLNYIDWIEISAPQVLAAQQDRLWVGEVQGLARLSGFSGPAEVFDVTLPARVRRIPVSIESRGEAVFSAEPGRQYLAVGPGGYLRPKRVAPVLAWPQITGADYVAVGPGLLLAAAQPLLDWRSQNGLQVLPVPLAAVYDRFSHGFPEPEAIQSLMRHAAQAWDPAPAYLLLLGDGSYDPQGHLAPAEANQLPTFLVDTVYGGETGSDVPFGQVDDDLWPEIAVGRLPARSPAQVAMAVEKILAYEQNLPEGDWQQRILAVADGQSASFRRDAQHFLDQFGADYHTDLIAPAAGAEGASQEVRRQWEAGSLLVAYFGHGSVTQWGKDNLFTNEDIAGLGNGDRLPVVVNMTCLTGLFTHPELDSLAEALLWEPEGGAVAVLAPTSLTLPNDQSFLSSALVEALQADPDATLGEISLAARRQISLDSPGGRDVMLTFLLFGDPALRLAR